MRSVLNRVLYWARRIKSQTMILWFSCKNPKTPLLPKLLTISVVAYALSPIDLIPDFIPILGLLDDAILLPIGIILAMKCIPQNVLDTSRARALEWERNHEAKPVSKVMALIVVIIWGLSLVALLKYFTAH
ncbi:DUF1232 domain-containing protein [Pseudomonas caspiana]|nr:YkvA family protein [Pseudomonas caspiana]TPG94700.1 DUF1232 domain-containing protein [Pseudomonas caspiana]